MTVADHTVIESTVPPQQRRDAPGHLIEESLDFLVGRGIDLDEARTGVEGRTAADEYAIGDDEYAIGDDEYAIGDEASVVDSLLCC